MRHLGSLSGSGSLRQRGKLVDDVSYQLDIYEGSGRQRLGYVDSTPKVMAALVNGEGLYELTLDDGQTVEIALTGSNDPPRHMNIDTSGPVPGF